VKGSIGPASVRQQFIEAVFVLDVAITQVANERLNGQVMLFRDCGVKLKEQLGMAKYLSEMFKRLARATGAAEINLGKFRNSLQKETDHQISIWISIARVEALSLFGTEEQVHAAMDQYLSIGGA